MVMLGWLGAKHKHLKRYVEVYNNKGIHAVTFVASVRDVLSFDLGKKLEERIERLTSELASWLSNDGGRGRDRFLIFHTFSNTGWLAYVDSFLYNWLHIHSYMVVMFFHVHWSINFSMNYCSVVLM